MMQMALGNTRKGLFKELLGIDNEPLLSSLAVRQRFAIHS